MFFLFLCFFVARYLGFLYFFVYLGLKGRHIFAEKKKTFVKGSAGAHYTRVPKFQGLTFKNGVDTWSFVR